MEMKSESGFSLAIASQPFQQHWTTIETDDAQDGGDVIGGGDVSGGIGIWRFGPGKVPRLISPGAGAG